MRCRMRAMISFLLSWLIAFPAFGAAVWPGNDGSLSTFATRGLVVGQNLVTDDRDNYVTNSDCFVGTTGIVTSGAGATIARNTTTPIGDAADCAVNLGTTGTGYVEWAVRTLPTGLASQQCALVVQAQTLSLGVASVEWQVVQGGNVVARVAAVATMAALPVLLPVPCSTSTTTIRVAHTAYTSGSTALKVTGVKYGSARGLGAIGDAANVTAWADFVPNTTQGLGTITAVFSKWRRNGDTMELDVRFNTGTVDASIARYGLPPGFTIGGTALGNHAGRWIRNSAAGAEVKQGSVIYVGGDNYVAFGVDDTAFAASPFAVRAGSGLFASSQTVSFFASVPIANWPTASSAVTPSQQNVSGSALMGMTSDFVSTANSYATVTNVTSRTSFGACETPTTSGQVACRISNVPPGEYEVSVTGQMVTESGSALDDNTSCFWTLTDGTTILPIGQGVARTVVASKPSYDGNSNLTAPFRYTSAQTAITWTLQVNRAGGTGSCSVFGSGGRSIAMSVKQTRGNVLPVFVRAPVVANQSAVAPIAGEVGERVVASRSTVFNASTTIGTYTDIASLAINVGPGVFDLYTICPLFLSWGSGLGYSNSVIAIRVGTTLVAVGVGGFAGDNAGSAAKPPGVSLAGASAKVRVNPSTATTYKTSMAILGFSGVPLYNVFDAQANYGDCFIEAVRAFDR